MDDSREKLNALYGKERARLLLLAERDEPQGEYARPVFSAGCSGSRVVLIGEAPGAEETKSGIPFVGKAGKQLDGLLSEAGIDRSDLFVTNAVKYRPVVRSERTVRNRTPGSKEVKDSLPLLLSELGLIRPAVTVTLGSTPLTAVLLLAAEQKRTIGELHGNPVPVHIGSFETVLFPLYHPASAIYNRSLTDTLREDALALGRFLEAALSDVL